MPKAMLTMQVKSLIALAWLALKKIVERTTILCYHPRWLHSYTNHYFISAAALGICIILKIIWVCLYETQIWNFFIRTYLWHEAQRLPWSCYWKSAYQRFFKWNNVNSVENQHPNKLSHSISQTDKLRRFHELQNFRQKNIKKTM